MPTAAKLPPPWQYANDRAQPTRMAAGSLPAESVNPVAVAAMAEVGIDPAGEDIEAIRPIRDESRPQGGDVAGLVRGHRHRAARISSTNSIVRTSEASARASPEVDLCREATRSEVWLLSCGCGLVGGHNPRQVTRCSAATGIGFQRPAALPGEEQIGRRRSSG
jgi:hypothetical protein